MLPESLRALPATRTGPREAALRVHHIQTGALRFKRRQLHGEGTGLVRQAKMFGDQDWTEPLPISAWVIEHPEGIIVVDTGESARATDADYFPRWHPYFQLQLRESVTPDQEIGPQLRHLGIPPEEVRWVVMTHLHCDHAGGLSHFPSAEIIVARGEYERAKGLEGQVRGYLPQHWPSWFAPRGVDLESESHGPFRSSLPITRAGDVVLVPTPGHTDNHVSVVLRDYDEGFTFLFAGDAAYSEGLMLNAAPDGLPRDDRLYAETNEQLRQFAQETPIIFLPTHDPHSCERLAGRITVGEPGKDKQAPG